MAGQVQKQFTIGGYTYTQKLIRCGKKLCTRCPHGPYWYMTINLRDGRKPVKYIGKSLPEGIEEPECFTDL